MSKFKNAQIPLNEIPKIHIDINKLRASNPQQSAQFDRDLESINNGALIWRGVMIVKQYEQQFLQQLGEGKVLRKAFDPNCSSEKKYAKGIGSNWTTNFNVANNFTDLNVWGGDELIDTDLPLTGIIFEARYPSKIDIDKSLFERISQDIGEELIVVEGDIELVRVYTTHADFILPKQIRISVDYCD